MPRISPDGMCESLPTMRRFSSPVRFSSTAAYWPARPMRSRTALRISRHIDAEHRRDARVGREDRRQDTNRRGLAGAVGPEQTEHGAGRHREIDAVERDDVAEALLESLHEDRIISHGTQHNQISLNRSQLSDDLNYRFRNHKVMAVAADPAGEAWRLVTLLARKRRFPEVAAEFGLNPGAVNALLYLEPGRSETDGRARRRMEVRRFQRDVAGRSPRGARARRARSACHRSARADRRIDAEGSTTAIPDRSAPFRPTR